MKSSKGFWTRANLGGSLAAAMMAAVIGSSPALAESALDTVRATHKLSFGWAEWKPLEYSDVVSNTLKGVLIDMAGAIAAKLDAKPVFVEDSWATLASGVAAGKFQVALLGITDGRAKVVAFTHPLYFTSFTAMVEAKSPFKTWDQLNQPGKSVSVTTGSNVDEMLGRLSREKKISADIVRIKDVGAGVLALSSGKVDGYADQKDALLEAAENQHQFRVLEGGFGSAQFGVAVPKQDTALAAAVDKAVVELVKDGTVKKLLDKYHVVGNEPAVTR